MSHISDAAIASFANKVTLSGATTLVIGKLIADNITVLMGLALAGAGFAVNLYYKHRDDRRMAEMHRRREEREAEMHRIRVEAAKRRIELAGDDAP